MRSFLRVHGLNNEAITSILDCATKNKLANDPGSCTNIWNFPVMWDRGVELSQREDVVMHLVFLGVVKTFIKILQDWMKERGKSDTFLKYTEDTLEAIQILCLSWRHCTPYKNGKLGGCISENYLAAMVKKSGRIHVASRRPLNSASTSWGRSDQGS